MTNEVRSGSNGYNITYTYDPVGNRLTEVNSGAATTSTYDPANQLVTNQDSSGVTTFTFDTAGNQVVTQSPTNQRTTNTWDFENRLVKALMPSGVVISLLYNGDGQRVQKQTSGGATTDSGWNGGTWNSIPFNGGEANSAGTTNLYGTGTTFLKKPMETMSAKPSIRSHPMLMARSYLNTAQGQHFFIFTMA